MLDRFLGGLDEILAVRCQHADQAPEHQAIQVLVADHRRLHAELVARLLDQAEEISVVGPAASVG